MKILHVIPSIHLKYGGPSKAIIEMCRFQTQQGILPEILTTHFKNEKPTLYSDLKIISIPCRISGYSLSLKLKKWLEKNIKKYDIIHIHSVFSYSSLIASKIAYKHNIPFVLRPCGALHQWSLQNKSSFIKKIYLKLYGKTLFKHSIIHFTTQFEKDDFNVYTKSKGNFILPNGVEDIKFNYTKKKFETNFPKFKNKKILLFLSRIHEKKGLNFLLPLLKNILKKDWIFVIAGNGDKSYIKQLKQIISKNNLNDKVHFTGSVYNDKKNMLFKHSKVFILPSHSENFGIAVAEAMQAGLPVLISNQVGIFNEVKKAKAGIIFPLNKQDIIKAVKKIMDNPKLAKQMGKNGKKLANNLYNWDTITKKQIKIYKKLKNGKNKCNCFNI